MKHVIHVDNSEFFRKLMKSFLSEKGLECESFEKGEDAVNAVVDGKASFVITGLSLADMGGEEFLKRLMTLPQKTPVIVVTSSDEVKRHKRLEALGVKSIISKSGDWKIELGKILQV
ncbi:MAG: response regulator [Treponema sp.]|nr:response regulator [Treponema sp.]MCL2272511.1 response regulator [Treponema sp.]